MRLVTHKWILAPHDSIPNVKMLLKIVWKKRRVLTPNHCPYFACFVVPATWVLFIPTSPDYFLSGHVRVPEHSTHFLLACSGRNQVGCDVFLFFCSKKKQVLDIPMITWAVLVCMKSTHIRRTTCFVWGVYMYRLKKTYRHIFYMLHLRVTF